MESAVRLLLIEPDPAQARLVQESFLAIKIANPLRVLPRPAELPLVLGIGTAGSYGESADVVLLGTSLSAEERGLVLGLVERAAERPLAVIGLGLDADQQTLSAWTVPRASGDRGVPLTQLPRLLERLALVITTA